MIFIDYRLKLPFLSLIALILLFFAGNSFSKELAPEEIGQDRYYSILTFDDELLATTRFMIQPGDEYLTKDLRLFIIEEVKNYNARASLQEKLDAFEKEMVSSLVSEGEKGSIGIFHTHNAESYVPSDGTHSIDGKGGIHAVGQAFADSLEDLGVLAIFSEDMHLPHDRYAYNRSRETILEIIQKEPDAIFDIHRNAAPYEVYNHELDNEKVTHLQFVVGLLNPHAEVNRSFSYDLKGVTNHLFPDLVKGVLYTQGGNFNQDLYPTLLLVEIGAHTNSREAAERSAKYFGESVYHYFYGWTGVASDPDKALPLYRSVLQTMVRIILLVLLLGVLFLAINSRDFQDFQERIFSMAHGILNRIQGLKKRLARKD